MTESWEWHAGVRKYPNQVAGYRTQLYWHHLPSNTNMSHVLEIVHEINLHFTSSHLLLPSWVI